LAADRTLVQIRERSFLDLLDLALVVVRHRPLALGLTALVGIAPFAALNAWLLSFSTVLAWVWIPLLAIEAPWATAPLTVVLGGMMFGERPSARLVAKKLLRALPALVLYQGVVRGALLLLAVFSPILPAKLGFMNEVILLERGRVAAVPGRSSRLSGDMAAGLFGQWALLVVVGALFVTAWRWSAEMLTGMLLQDTSESSWSNESGLAALGVWLVDLKDWRAQVGIWVVVAFTALVRFLTYIDRRIRLEGWEVELRLRAAGAAMEESERW